MVDESVNPYATIEAQARHIIRACIEIRDTLRVPYERDAKLRHFVFSARVTSEIGLTEIAVALIMGDSKVEVFRADYWADEDSVVVHVLRPGLWIEKLDLIMGSQLAGIAEAKRLRFEPIDDTGIWEDKGNG